MIYFDHNATTPVLPEVFEAMRPFFCDEWGNPSSAYQFGSKLKTIIGGAREQVANLIGASPEEILFTSCATESNNAAIQAALKSNPAKRHIVTSVVEHSSVLNHCQALEKEGCRVTYLPVNRDGLLNLADLENSLTDQTAVVSLMWANNETGVLFPVQEIAKLCRERGVLFHCDAAQAAGKVEINLRQTPVDYLSLSGHKFYAPKGVGALYIGRNSPFVPFLHGGHQENGLRGGTENVPLIIGLGKAAELAARRLQNFETQLRPFRNNLEASILAKISNTEVNGHRDLRIANTTNIIFRGVESEALLVLLDQAGICASKGSACLGNSDGPSHVIKAMKPDGVTARESLRFSLGVNSREDEVYACVDTLIRSVGSLRI
ncbi:MAG TPA: aminotransferase class V-fold PLP-dependent enzyme [Verrucomicrobiae bacterium]|nr:aminotransferase class V-fold PLP-dependent enzyme [Verrucomicrobiae bacterium]